MTDRSTNLQCVHGRLEPEKVKSNGAGFKNIPKNIKFQKCFTCLMVLSGGGSNPTDCKADQKVAFIIPYR